MKRITYVLLWLLLSPALLSAEEGARKTATRTEVLIPPLAQRMGIHGTVKAKLWVNPDGTVRRVEYVSGHPLLADSAMSALKKWTFTPASAETTEVVEVKF